MTRFVSISALLVGFTLTHNAEAQRRQVDRNDSLGQPIGGHGGHDMSGVGDSELGLQWNGSDSFANPYARYFFKDNLAVELGAEIDYLNFDNSDSDPSRLVARGGLFYELKDNPRARCYVAAGGLYQRDVFDQGGDRITQNDIGDYFNVGGDVRVRKGL